MKLPIAIPFLPMEAKIASEIPIGEDWEYEPKWDGFRCLAFRSGNEVELQSKSAQPLTRYFPEVVAALLKVEAEQFVLDGELIVAIDGRLSFDDLLQRIHPAASRVKTLSHSTPAQFIVFDLLVDQSGSSLIAAPLEQRRKALEMFHGNIWRRIKPLSYRGRPEISRLHEDGLRVCGGNSTALWRKEFINPICPASGP
jgi:ATP-dependent DNA ligase